jgi:hypothetical protein
LGFFIAVGFANVEGAFADVMEKWVSWFAALIVLSVGRLRE